jgi:hypothetical protein
MTRIETGNTDVLRWGARKFAVLTLSPFLRAEMTDKFHSFDKAKKILKEGNGLIVVINHFSKKDPFQAIREIFYHRVTDSKKLIAPIAYHMDHKVLHYLAPALDVTRKVIVTRNTLDEGKNNGLELNFGKKEYYADTIKLLRKGGIILLAPQATRMPNLGQPHNRAAGGILKFAQESEFTNFAFLFMGIGIKGIDDYSTGKIRGLNLLKRYTVNIGPCLTSKEILEKAGGDFRNVDGIIYEELGKVVPKAYR